MARRGLLCAVRAASGTPAASQRSASSVQADGRNSRNPTGSGTSPHAKVSETSTWQFATLPSSPQYCRATPTESSPFLGTPTSSTTSTAPTPPPRPPTLPVALFGQHVPQRRVIPGLAADEMVQRVVAGQAKPLGHRLDALAPAPAPQSAHIQRPPLSPRAAPGRVEEGLKPVVEVSVDIARQCDGGSRLHA